MEETVTAPGGSATELMGTWCTGRTTSVVNSRWISLQASPPESRMGRTWRLTWVPDLITAQLAPR